MDMKEFKPAFMELISHKLSKHEIIDGVIWYLYKISNALIKLMPDILPTSIYIYIIALYFHFNKIKFKIIDWNKDSVITFNEFWRYCSDYNNNKL